MDTLYRLLDFRPHDYPFMFPSTANFKTKPISIEYLDNLANQGLFPILPHLIPALFYAFYLSVARYFLSWLVFQVNN